MATHTPHVGLCSVRQEIVRAQVEAMIQEADTLAAVLARETPKATDGHSDGKRVRYVRHTVTADTLRQVLAIIDGTAA